MTHGPIGRRRGHRGIVALLLSVLAVCLILHSVDAAAAASSPPTMCRGWSVLPEPDVALRYSINYNFSSLSEDDIHEENQRYLVRAGLPFLLDLQDSQVVEDLQEMVVFAKGSSCPNYHATPSHRGKWYASLFDATLLEKLFGPRRFADLVQLTTFTDFMRSFEQRRQQHPFGVTPTLLPMEMDRLLRQPDAHFPGSMGVRVVVAKVVLAEWTVSFGDLWLEAGSDGSRTLRFDISGAALRQKRVGLLRATLHYKVGVDAYDAAVVRERVRMVHQMDHYAEEAAKKAEQHEQLRLAFRKFDASRTRAPPRKMHVNQPSFITKSTTHPAARQWSPCGRIQKAICFIVGSQIPFSDIRVKHLSDLFYQRRCGSPMSFSLFLRSGLCGLLPGVFVEPRKDLNCTALVRAVTAFGASSARQRGFSTSQTLAAFYAAYETSREGRHSEDFATRVLTWIERGALGTCTLPRAVHADILYVAGLLRLMGFQTIPKSNSLSARAFLNLQQAAWKGSVRATATMATAREHGIFAKQSMKVAASLLMTALTHSNGHMHHRLLESYEHGGGPRPSPAELLRFERPYGITNSWTRVDYPRLHQRVRRSVTALTESDDGYDEDDARHIFEENPDEGGRSIHVYHLLLHAVMLTHHNGQPDLAGAECAYLVALRRLGYLCDVEEVPGRLDDACPQHRSALDDLLSDTDHPRIQCRRGARISMEEVLRGDGDDTDELSSEYLAPPHEGHFWMIHEALISLAYLHLIQHEDGGMEMASMYAALSVDLSMGAFEAGLRAFVSTMEDAQAEWEKKHTSSRPHGNPKALATAIEGAFYAAWDGDGSWYAIQLLQQLVSPGHPIQIPLDELLFQKDWTKDVDLLVDYFQPLVAHFLLPDAFVVLASSGLGAAGNERVRSRSYLHRVEAMMMHASQAHITASHHHHHHDDDDDPDEHKHLCLAFLLDAAVLSMQERVYYMDRLTNSPHRADAQLMLSWMLRHHSSSISLDRLRTQARAHVVLHHDHFGVLPRSGDSLESFRERLLRMKLTMHAKTSLQLESMQHISRTTPPRSDGVAEHKYVDSKPLSRRRMHSLREAMTRSMESDELVPLLYARDIHADVQRSKWNPFDVIGRSISNAFFYLFTETTEEAYYREYGEAVTATAGMLARAEDPHDNTSCINRFLTKFAVDKRFREFSMTTMLVSTTMQLGSPEGFSLLFRESMEHQNPFVESFVRHLSTSVWGPATAEMWRAEHLSAQTHAHGGQSSRVSSSYTVELRAPFLYAVPEARQELMGLVDRWKAAWLVSRLPEFHDPDVIARVHRLVEERLLQCTSYVWSRMRRMPPQMQQQRMEKVGPYDGQLWPAGDVLCAMDLHKLLHGRNESAKVQADIALRLLKELAHRQSYYYLLTDDAPSDRSRPSSRAAYKKLERRPARLVEPWRRLEHGTPSSELRIGEGYYFNARLHIVTAANVYASLHPWWVRLEKWVGPYTKELWLWLRK